MADSLVVHTLKYVIPSGTILSLLNSMHSKSVEVYPQALPLPAKECVVI